MTTPQEHRDALGAWYRADKERARVAYAAADSATLAALLPVLDQLTALHKDEMQHWQEALDLEPELNASLEEARGEALAAWSVHTEGRPDVAEAVTEMGAQFRRLIDENRDSSAALYQEAFERSFHMLAALAGRRQEAVAELERRGLLPESPVVGNA